MRLSLIEHAQRTRTISVVVVVAVLAVGCAAQAPPRAAAHPSPVRPDASQAAPPQSGSARSTPASPATTSRVAAGALAVSSLGGTALAVVTLQPPADRAQGPITVMQLTPGRTRLVLHAGSTEPAAGLALDNGPVIGGSERTRLVAAFNGGFKIKEARGGWMSQGRTVSPLQADAASVVIYQDGGTDIGAWDREVPQTGRAIASVRQNLELLIDHSRAQRTERVAQPVLNLRWGHAFREHYLVSRSALGITASGALIWAAGTKITVASLAHALLTRGVVRALELDINAPLVRGFLFPGPATVTSKGRPATTELPLVLGQTQTVVRPPMAQHCTYLDACQRDYFTVLATTS